MTSRQYCILVPIIWLWLQGTAVFVLADVTPFQIDDFEDGTTSGWQHGIQNPNAPRVVDDGGRGGTGDAYLEFSSHGGFGPGSKLIIFNDQDHWTGSYLGDGSDPVLGLAADLNNFSPDPLTMWFSLDAIYESGGEEVQASAVTEKVELAPQSGWQHAFFSLRPEDLTSDGDPLQVLDNVTRIWFFHNESEPVHPAPSVMARFGIDNLTAIGEIVEPPPGDYNNNGLVEQEDLDLVLANWGKPAAEAPAAWVNDPPQGNIDQTELDKVLVNWGNSTGTIGVAPAVPEPATCLLLLLAASLWWARARRS